MWENKILYWAWRGNEIPDKEPPTQKTIKYASITYRNWKPNPLTMHIACAVFDDDIKTELNEGEIEWHRKNGAEIVMPEY